MSPPRSSQKAWPSFFESNTPGNDKSTPERQSFPPKGESMTHAVTIAPTMAPVRMSSHCSAGGGLFSSLP